jgi:hypothetical protein
MVAHNTTKNGLLRDLFSSFMFAEKTGKLVLNCEHLKCVPGLLTKMRTTNIAIR